MKPSFEEISCLLDDQDIEYLSNLLYTIEIVPELRARIIPQENARDGKSNFVRVEYKINQIAKYFHPKQKASIIKPPINPLKKSRLTKSKNKVASQSHLID
jgi:hypothetical protein